MEIVVSPDGVDANEERPTAHGRCRRALTSWRIPGDVLSLRGGTYVGSAILKEKIGTPDNPIVIRSFPGEHAVLDGATTRSSPSRPTTAGSRSATGSSGQSRSSSAPKTTGPGIVPGAGPVHAADQLLPAPGPPCGEPAVRGAVRSEHRVAGFRAARRQQARDRGSTWDRACSTPARADPTSSTKTPVWATSTSG